MASVHQRSPSFGEILSPNLAAQHIDAFVRYYDSPVGGVGKHHSHQQVPVVIEAEHWPEI